MCGICAMLVMCRMCGCVRCVGTQQIMVNWNEYFTNDVLSDNYTFLVDKIRIYLDTAHPIKTFKIRPDDPFFDHDVANLVSLKKIFLRRSRRARRANRPNWYTNLIHAKRLMSRIKTLLLAKRRSVITDNLRKHKDDPRKFWQVINKIWKGEKQVNVMCLKDEDGNLISSENTAEFVNHYYGTIGEKLAGNFAGAASDADLLGSIVTPDVVFQFEQCAIEPISKLCGNIKLGKSSGIPDIRANVIKDVVKNNPEILRHLVNSSLAGSRLPRELKSGCIIPLPKSGSPQDVSNWRPVCLLNIFSKLIEKCAHKQLIAHMLVNNLLDNKQFGFLPGRSTVDATFSLIQALYEARNKSNYSVVVFLDFKKAFDTVNHNILLKKLSKYGCNADSVSWFKDYLQHRTQTTFANNVSSTREPINCGVPQGSVLGPLLFIIYVNDIVSILENSSHFLYADDLAIVVSGKSVDILVTLLQDDLNRIQLWCDNNMLTVNTKKTQVLWCYPLRYPPDLSNCDIFLCDNLLKRVKEFNYLGVIIDHDLQFKAQCKKVRSMAFSRFIQLQNIKQNIDEALSLCIYKSMILPVMDYCDFIIDSGPVANVRKLQTTQNKCLRLCLGIVDPRDIPIHVLHTRCKMDLLSERRNCHLLSLMYRMSKNLDNIMIPVRVLRNNINIKFKVNRPILESFRSSPLYRGMLSWDSLDAVVQHSVTLEIFKSRI